MFVQMFLQMQVVKVKGHEENKCKSRKMRKTYLSGVYAELTLHRIVLSYCAPLLFAERPSLAPHDTAL